MNIFNKPYYRDSFLNDFLIDFLPDDFETEETPIPFEFSAGYISRVTRIGTCKSLKLDVFEMIHSSHNDARIGVSKDAFKILYNNSLCNRALVIFVPDSSRNNYRFSLLQIDASIDENDRLVRQYSNPRRFSFLLGTDAHIKTPTQFLIERGAIRERQEGNKLLNSFDDLLSRFSVEALTKQFYNELFKWYEWAIKISFFPKGPAEDVTLNQENNEQNIIRLITRIIFVWFIKQKNLVPDKIFDKRDLFNIINDFEPMSSESSSYYNAILQNLFFATLNRAVIDEQGCKRQFKNDNPEENNPHYGIKSFYRDNKVPKKSLFKISHQEVIDYFSTIPFLNGGLFECLDEIEDNSNVTQNYIDGFSREPSNRAFIPNILFFEPEEGLLPILSRYNFTIEENSPKEVQVALDPELLGKVFENLLGAYNPETRETARNQSGSFYTPKEIVEFMVDESLKAYLGNKEYTNLLFTQDELPIELQNDPEECNRISRKLSTAKILDPACGSGAFPMGMLNKMVELLEKLDYKKERDIGDIKLQLIENCIYGSDIQTIAVQISKLRFFISLICHFERNDHDKTNNYGIPILPNLETKFVAANSLISIKQKEGYGGLYTDPTGEIESTKRELLNIRKKHFSAHSSFLKIQLRKDDKEARQKLSKLLSVNIYAPQDAKQIAEWNPYDQNKTSSFFDPYWMFGVTEKFDIVIGNPPYVQLQNNGGKLASLYENFSFDTFTRTGDIYCLFYERGYQLLKDRGHLCFITSNKWMRAGYGEKTRRFLATKTNPKLLVDFAGLKLFESATVDTNIILFAKENNAGKTICAVTKNDKKCIKKLSDFVQQEHTSCSFQDSTSWIVLSPIEQSIKRKIESVGTPLKDWDIKIYRGILTGLNDAFIISGEKRNEILNNCISEEERIRTADLIRPILRGRDIKRYGYNWANLWLIATFPSKKYDIELFPAVKNYLLSFAYGYLIVNGYKWVANHYLSEFCQKKLEQKGIEIIINGKHILDCNGNKEKSRKKTSNKWFETQDSISYWDLFFKPKICWKAVGRNLAFSIVDSGIFLTAPACFISAGKYNNIILSYLCSKVGTYFIYKNSDTTGAGDIMLNIQSLVKFPVPFPLHTNLVSGISKEMIDKFVYSSYAFSNEEISYIENNI